MLKIEKFIDIKNLLIPKCVYYIIEFDDIHSSIFLSMYYKINDLNYFISNR